MIHCVYQKFNNIIMFLFLRINCINYYFDFLGSGEVC